MRTCSWILCAAAAVGCAGKVTANHDGGGVGANDSSGRSHSGDGGVGAPTLLRSGSHDKLDILFVIDNTARMGDKQTLLAAAVPDLLNRLISPNCVDGTGNATGSSYSPSSGCAAGNPEFSPVHDMHIGIVTPSLGGRGGDQCAPDARNQANMALNAHDDDQAHLIIRWGSNETPTADAQSATGQGGGFLAWFPPVPANMAQGKVPPDVTPLGPNPGSAPNGQPQMGTHVGDFMGMVQGVHEHGCGFEGPNEAFYRFLIQPDPFSGIQLMGQTASLVGVDTTILQQRADFLRPDSVVAIVVVTQKSESVADPMAIGGQGWVFENSTFPGSPNLAAPEGTIECKQPVDPNNPTTTGPYGPNCTSCAFVKSDPNFATRCPNDGSSGTQGYLDPTDDALNVRFFHQKLRFGVSVEYPTSRYVRGLSESAVPDSGHEHDKTGNYVGDDQANCVNPLFATNLPSMATADLCALQRGPRTPDMIYYAAIAGVPHQLLQEDPTNPDSPQKDTLSAADWKLVNGADPEHYDFTGTDFHMIESILPRTTNNLPPGVVNASQCPTDAADDCDPISGREIETNKAGLQFACVFPLQMPKDCASAMYTGVCDCAAMAPNDQTPLCEKVNGAYTQTQIASRVLPSVREMTIARAMGAQGIVSSLCPIHPLPANGDVPPDPLWGYRPAMNTLVNRLAPSLRASCPSLPVAVGTDGAVPCQVFVVTSRSGASCMDPQCDVAAGLSAPSVDALASFCGAAEAAWQKGGGYASGLPEPGTANVCTLAQLTPASRPGAFDSTGSCASPTDGSLGWCYATGEAAGSCPQAIVFTNGEPPPGASVYFTCQ